MPKAPLYNSQGQKIGEFDLNTDIFGIEVNQDVLHEAVVMQLASRRQGTAKTKTIGEVRGGGRKPYRQKGTGRARQGSTRSPLWPGGATLFGPQPRDYGYKLPKKVRRLALKSALSAKANANQVIVFDELKFEAPKTKKMFDLLESVNAGKKALIVAEGDNSNIILSSRNIPGTMAMSATGLNVYDILNSSTLVLTREAVNKVEEVLA